ncbi:unnamed protein product [Cyprideis torosa]|uniref:Uncharacterized protein n=1 Tax=Cyprideis torosa TaxID=163714 RepID=A0A7R8WB66_9CRUS|nr:unnamed protein product [Cyprideis torosa]CAG0889177.1 unnamed protein product [Cyprideis torosa]
MAGIIKNQILKHLSRFLKKGSMGTDRINISTFKGEGEMQNLELDEMVMTELLSLPTWLRIKRAHCNYVKLRIPWAHLKNVPIQLFLDEVQIELETLEQLRPSESSTVPSYSSGGKYGFADKVVDGATVSVNSVSITLTSKAFLATIQLSRILLESRTPHFKRGELRATRVKDMDRGLILLFKQLSWETSKVEARSTLNPTLSPLRLIANESTARISIKKSLNDCSVLACRLILILKKQHYVLTDSQLKATHTFLISVAHLIREAQEQAKGQKAARKFKPPSRRRPSVPKQNPPASSQLRKASGLIPTLLRRGSFVTTPHATQSLPTTPPAKGRQGKPPHRRKTSASIDQSPRPNTLTPAAARSQPLRSAAAGGKPTKPHSAFDYFDVLETSYHLYAESLELHICDDPGESSSKHPDLLSGGTLHLWFSCLQLDFYPYHLLSSGRSHWFRYHPNQLSDWAVDDLARFQEQLHLLTSSATKGHVPVHRTDGPQSFSNSVPHSPRGERRLSASTASNFSTLMATCVVLRIPEFCIDNVSTSQRTHVTEFITVPASKVYLTVSPLQIRVDPLTLCWLNAFAANLLEGAEEAAEFAPPVDYVELRVEAIMPTVILEAPPFPLPPPPSRPRHPPTPRQPKEKGLPDRPTALHITASRVVATNSRQGPVGSRHQLDFTLNHLQKELFDGNCVGWSRVSSSAEEEEEDLDPIHDRFRRHAQGDDVPLFPRFPLSKSSLWSDPLDVWFLQLSPLFASFTTNRQQGEDLQVVLNPIPVEIPGLDITGRVQYLQMWKAASGRLSPTVIQQLLWLYDSRLPTPVPATGSSSSLEAESSCSAHINVICNLTSLASVLLTRQQYLFLMRIVDDLTVLMDTMESDTIRITGKPNATKAVASIYIPAVIRVLSLAPAEVGVSHALNGGFIPEDDPEVDGKEDEGGQDESGAEVKQETGLEDEEDALCPNNGLSLGDQPPFGQDLLEVFIDICSALVLFDEVNVPHFLVGQSEARRDPSGCPGFGVVQAQQTTGEQDVVHDEDQADEQGVSPALPTQPEEAELENEHVVDVSFAAPPVFPGATSEIPEINSDPCLFDGVVQSAGVDVPSPLSQDSEPFSGQLFNKLPPIPSSYQLSPQRPHPLDPLVTSTQHDPESPGLNRIPMSLGGRSNIFLDQSSSVFKRGDRSGSMPFVLDTSYLEDDSVSVISSDSDSFVITSSAASTVGDGEYHSLLLDTETPTGNRQAPAMNAGVDEVGGEFADEERVEEACEALSNELDEESSCEGPYAGNGVTRNLKKNKPRPMSIKSEKEISKGLDQITCVNFRVGQIQVVAQVRDSKTLAKVLCSHVSHQDQPPLLWEELVAEFGRKSKEWRDSFPELTKNCDIKLRCCVSPVSKPLCQPFDETLISISPEKIKNLTQRFAKALEDVPPVDIWKDIVSHGGMFMEADIQDLSLTLMASSSLVLANFFEEEMLKPSLPIKLSLSRVRLTLPDDKPSFNPPLLVSLGDVTVLRDCLGVVHILPLKDLIHHRDESRSQGNFSSKRPLGQQEGGGGGKETEAELRARLKAAEERIKKLTLALQNSERDLFRVVSVFVGQSFKMLAIINRILDWFRSLFWKEEMELTLVGLQYSGKTTFVNVIASGQFSEDMIPTVGFNMRKITKGNVTIKVWDIGGQPRFRSMWERYCRGVNAIVYMVDAADREKIEASRNELHNLLDKPQLAGIPVLVLGNKRDLPNACDERALIDRMNLSAIQDREICCYSISCKEKDNIDLTLQWLIAHSKSGGN